MEERTAPNGDTVHVDTDEREIGSKGPFYATYTTPEGDTRWGWFCSNCETFDNAMDTMGRIQCNECDNFRKPDEWDDAHE